MATSKKTEEAGAAAARAEEQGAPRERASDRARAVAVEEKAVGEEEGEEASDGADGRRSIMLFLLVARATTAALGDCCADLIATEALTRGELNEVRMLKRKTKINFARKKRKIEISKESEKNEGEKLDLNSTSQQQNYRAFLPSMDNHLLLLLSSSRSNSTASAPSPCRRASRP